MKFSLALLSVVSAAAAAYVPSEPWSTLTPDATAPSCAHTEYTSSFGIAIETITTAVNIKAKRDLAAQIQDGQVQKTTGSETESDVTSTEYITETIGSSTVTFDSPSISASAGTLPPVIVTQIGDGQIQVPNPTPVVSSSASSHSSYSFRSIESKTVSSATATPSSSECPNAPVANKATCKTKNDLAITLENGVLKDSHDRIGSIVSNRQFQFDGPTPQAGAIYAAGWSIKNGHLVLGDDEIFWQCLSGDFYNLYDEAIGAQCTPIHLNVIDLVDC